MSEDMPIHGVARAVGLSLHHFHRLFVEGTGETPAGYLRRIRLDAAALRLRWTDETVGTIAVILGYASQAAFTRAFRVRFGVTPAHFRSAFRSGLGPLVRGAALQRVRVREVQPFTAVARRYVGSLEDVRLYWQDFARTLPAGFAEGPGTLFLGLVYDDPRLTPGHQIRYDCCATLGESAESDRARIERNGLRRITTRPGRYACLDHRGSWETVADSYYLVCDRWLTTTGSVVADDPAIEAHSVRRDRQPRESLVFTILVPLD